MTDRLRRKIEETKAIAGENGLDLRSAPLLATFEMPIWGTNLVAHEIRELARQPGTAVAVVSEEPLPKLRQDLEHAPHLHVIAERGLVCGLSGGAVLHVYPQSEQELLTFAVALFAGAAAANIPFAHCGNVSSGRQEVAFGAGGGDAPLTALELQNAIRHHGGTGMFAGEACEAVVIDDLPAELEAARRALAAELAGRTVHVTRMPSGRFRISPGPQAQAVDHAQAQVLAQEIAMSCDRFVEARGGATFGFVTESVARWQYGRETAARRLAQRLFNAPDTVITHLGLHPFTGEGTLFFAYEGSETVWEAANKAISCITVRDILEYGCVLYAIRRGE